MKKPGAGVGGAGVRTRTWEIWCGAKIAEWGRGGGESQGTTREH